MLLCSSKYFAETEQYQFLQTQTTRPQFFIQNYILGGGTPHWHLLLFMSLEHVAKVREIIQYYTLQTDGDEHGADKHRFTAITFDKKKGTAIGYIVKYISKNIDGYR